ncbi:unnamed protein product [Mytilus edulis]|uniref:Uncharacterized protein n=1 Tax=Mytilus edulis TaxID=6550 RepID=A0A8S3QM20_MYTED|nr:unnamed protein product [Mytilus edulis]
MLTVIIGPTAVSLDNVTQDNKIPGIEGKDMPIKCTAVGGHPPPDIKLVILGSTYTSKQSAQRTFKPNSSMDCSTVTCQAGYTDISYFPLNTTAYIHLKLKPNISPFDSDTVDIEETKYFIVSCQSSGSRPAASMYWLLGQQNITLNTTSQSYHDPSTDKYSVTSNLRYRLNRNYNGLKLICRASNVAGSMETSIRVNIKLNTCKWQHRSKYGEYIREFSNNNQTLTLPTVPEDQRYQDTGEYVCTAENGIIGTNGQLKQTGFGYVISNDVQLDGYRVTLTISNLQEADFTNYTLRLYYSSQYVLHEVTLQSSSPPETPSNFTISSSKETSITVQWIPGYDGGQTQTFYIEYRITGSSEWVPWEVKNSNQFDSYMVYTLTGFQDETSYELRMYAKNKFNQSQHTDIETIRTQKSDGQMSSNAIIGTVAGVLVVLLIVCAVIISILVFKEKRNAGFYENSEFQNVQIRDEYEKVISKSDTEEKQTSKTYEPLRPMEAVEVYDDLENDKVDHYEALGTQDKPNVYEELENQKGQAEKVYVNEAF